MQLVRERPLIQSPGKLKLSSPSPEAANNYFSRLVDEIPADKQAAFYNLRSGRKTPIPIFTSSHLLSTRSKAEKDEKQPDCATKPRRQIHEGVTATLFVKGLFWPHGLLFYIG